MCLKIGNLHILAPENDECPFIHKEKSCLFEEFKKIPNLFDLPVALNTEYLNNAIVVKKNFQCKNKYDTLGKLSSGVSFIITWVMIQPLQKCIGLCTSQDGRVKHELRQFVGFWSECHLNVL